MHINFKTLFASVIFVLAFIIVKAQDKLKDSEIAETKKDTKRFRLASLDRSSVSVQVIPDYANHVLKFVCANDTIKITDFWGVPPELRLLNKNFLQIKYAVRGGSNLELGNILILCIKNRKLTEAIHVLENANSDHAEYKSNYKVEFVLSGFNTNNYKLKALIYDSAISKEHPEENYIYNNQTILNFDQKHSVFYSIKKTVYNRVLITKGQKQSRQKVGGNYPAIIFKDHIYYFINNRWLEAQAGNDLSEI